MSTDFDENWYTEYLLDAEQDGDRIVANTL